MNTNRRAFFGMLAAAPLLPLVATEAEARPFKVTGGFMVDARGFSNEWRAEFLRSFERNAQLCQAAADRAIRGMVDNGPFFSSTPEWGRSEHELRRWAE